MAQGTATKRRYRVRVVQIESGWRWLVWDNREGRVVGPEMGYGREAAARGLMHRLMVRNGEWGQATLPAILVGFELAVVSTFVIACAGGHLAAWAQTMARLSAALLGG